MTDYQGIFHYENQVLKFIATAEGYVNVSSGGRQGPNDPSYVFSYVYNYTDHLGNIRLSYTKGSGTNPPVILEENHYYPFGLKHKKYGSVDKDLVCVDEDCYEVGIDVVPPQARKTYQYKYQGQELQDELGLNWYSFKFRNYSPDLGRFWSIDPLSEDYVHNSTYAFAENKVVNSRELEGLEAWESINNWDEKTIQQYRDYASQRAEQYRTGGNRCTCEDFAINVLIDFASENKLPVHFSNGTGNYNSSSKYWKDVETFRYDVLKTTAATDLLESTIATPKEQLQSGDIILHKNEKGRVNHTQLVTGGDSKVLKIHQGNFVSNFDMVNYLRFSSDPKRFYIGETIQSGLYMKKTGDYFKDGKKTQGLLNSNVTEGRTWNFSYFDWKEKFMKND